MKLHSVVMWCWLSGTALLGCQQAQAPERQSAAPAASAAAATASYHPISNVDFLTIISAPPPAQVAPHCAAGAVQVQLEVDGKPSTCRSFLDQGTPAVQRLFCDGQGQSLAPNRAYRLEVVYRLERAGKTLDLARGRVSDGASQLHAGINPFDVTRAGVATGFDDDRDGVSNLEEACPGKTAARH